MHWAQPHRPKSVVEAWHTLPGESIAKLAPGMGMVFMQITPLHKHMTLVRVQFQP
jgi:hypothetical protein